MSDQPKCGTEQSDVIPWDELSRGEKSNFARVLNRRFGASLSVEEASEYYGDREKAEAELGDDGGGDGYECPECFTTLYRDDIPHLKRTGKCPNCGEVLVS